MSSLWLDRSGAPAANLLGLELNTALNHRLKALVSGHVPHLLFHGPSGAGKRTRIVSFLAELFGNSIKRVKLEQRSFKPPFGGKEVVLSTLSSNHHIELNPSDVGKSDRHVVQTLFREIAENNSVRPLFEENYGSASGGDDAKTGFKVVVLNEADKMSLEAQAALRRMLEKCMQKCRVILCCEHINRVIEPIRSRCQIIRVPSPRADALAPFLQLISKKEGVTLPADEAKLVAECRDVRRAILSIQRNQLEPKNKEKNGEKPGPKSENKEKNGEKPERTMIAEADWEEQLRTLGTAIVNDPSLNVLQQARERLAELSHVPADMILTALSSAMMEAAAAAAPPLLLEIAQLVADADWRIAKGTTRGAILHLEHLISQAALAAAKKIPQ